MQKWLNTSLLVLKFHCGYETLVPVDGNDPLEEAIGTPFFLFRAIVGLEENVLKIRNFVSAREMHCWPHIFLNRQ
jgi:hypothetical protein